MKKKLFLMCMSIMFLLAGCGNVAELAIAIAEDPHGPLIAASIVYQETVEALVVLRDQGLFNNKEITEITQILTYLDEVFYEWHVMIDAGTVDMDYKAAFEECVKELEKYVLIATQRSTA